MPPLEFDWNSMARFEILLFGESADAQLGDRPDSLTVSLIVIPKEARAWGELSRC